MYNNILNLVTESNNPASLDIDLKSVLEILHIINSEDKTVPYAVECEIPYIANAIDIIVNAFQNNGRLFYVGAGTSGRIGVLDASEIPPTFGTDINQVRGIIAGGHDAIYCAQEGAEDKEKQGAIDIIENGITVKDVVCGISASKRTPYVLGAIKKAKLLGAKTIYLTCSPRSEIDIDVDVMICPVVGPEVVRGSTRMKAGTAQKLVLNMITTTVMIQLGKVYNNMMVDLQMTSQKLVERSKSTIILATGVDYETASRYLDLANGHVKTAIVMILKNVNFDEAKVRLQRSNGFVRKALE
ncbi:N-acetylmuramic acid 6-phosphate etherase [candidate division KSB1 bacterium]|nr:N-acetylmuramic acid 6-phosphate etherase [candidate division KSB1 bacterium]